MNTKNKQFLIQAKTIVDLYIDQTSFSATDFCEAMHLSRSQFHRKLKQITGMSTTDFIRHQRLGAAAKLLKQGDKSVTTIAYQVGFNNMSYFSKCFKAKYGCKPSEFAAIDSSDEPKK